MATFFRIFQRYGDPSQSSKQAESYTERSRIVEDRSGARMSCGVSGTYPAGPELRRVVSTNAVFRPQPRNGGQLPGWQPPDQNQAFDCTGRPPKLSIQRTQ